MSNVVFRPYSLVALLVVCTLTSACSANLPTPAWIDVNSVGVLCRVTTVDNNKAKQLEDQVCEYAMLRLKKSLGDGYAVERIVPPDSRILETNRVTLVLDARLEWQRANFQGYSLTLSSSRYRHNPGAPARALFFESPSVVFLPQSQSEALDTTALAAKLNPVLELHLRRLMQ